MPNINKNIIMQAGAAVANATNIAAGLTASTPEPGSIISAIQLVNGGRTVGPDALAHFTESVRNKLLSLLVSMEPIQDFNGYDHPWPGGGGKNLIDAPDITLTANGYIFNLTGLSIPDGTYTLSWSQQGASTPSLGVSGEDGDYINTTITNPYTFTVSGVITGIRLYGSATTYSDIQLESGSAKTSFSPYANICPITGRTGLDVYVGPTSAIGDATTYSMDWTSPAGTVYAGSADIVSGDINAAPYYASYNGETLVGPWVSSMDVYDPEGTPTTGAQVVDLGGAMTEYHITGQDIITLVGDNYIWSDSGDVTITE